LRRGERKRQWMSKYPKKKIYTSSGKVIKESQGRVLMIGFPDAYAE
jgi:hypothetical protein